MSQTRQADEILYEGVAPWLTICVLVTYLGVFEWLRWLLTIPPSAWIAAGFTVAAAALTAYFLLREWPELRAAIRRHTLGATGERSVAEVLDGLRCGGCEVFHDLVDNGFNIDHVMVGPTGVYVIETKSRSKHVGRRNVHVTYDGRRIRVDGREPDRDPIVQVHALAERVREIIQVETGLRPPIRPVVLFPGWYVDKQPRGVSVWVLSPKALPGFIRQERTVLKRAEVERIALAIARHARG